MTRRVRAYDPHVSQVDPELLARLPVFRRVRLEDRQRIAAVARVRSYERGDPIFTEGDAPEFFVVISGRAKVFRQHASGRDVILHLFGPGDPIG